MNDTQTLSPAPPNETEEAARRLLKKATGRGLLHCARAGRSTARCEEHFGPGSRGATRVKCMTVAVEMMTEML
jgi:hypothetical protein